MCLCCCAQSQVLRFAPHSHKLQVCSKISSYFTFLLSIICTPESFRCSSASETAAQGSVLLGLSVPWPALRRKKMRMKKKWQVPIYCVEAVHIDTTQMHVKCFSITIQRHPRPSSVNQFKTKDAPRTVLRRLAASLKVDSLDDAGVGYQHSQDPIYKPTIRIWPVRCLCRSTGHIVSEKRGMPSSPNTASPLTAQGCFVNAATWWQLRQQRQVARTASM
jgi:hypothetical protein